MSRIEENATSTPRQLGFPRDLRALVWHESRSYDDANMRSVQQYVRPRWSFADLERMPDDGRRYEIYDGELFEMPSPTLRHQRVAQKLLRAVEDYERAVGGLAVISPIDIVLDDFNVVQPDVVFFTRDRVAALDVQKVIRIPPDLAIEVMSPSSAANDRGRKMRLLARFGVREYWIVDPLENIVERFVREGNDFAKPIVVSEDDALTSSVLPGFEVSAAQIFTR
jgi:Uma2 family endonuclease